MAMVENSDVIPAQNFIFYFFLRTMIIITKCISSFYLKCFLFII